MKLIYTITGKPVAEGDHVQSRGESYIVAAGLGCPPHKPSSTGRISVQNKHGNISTYFPNVFDAKWVTPEEYENIQQQKLFSE